MNSKANIVDPGTAHLWDDYITHGRPHGSVYEDALARHYLPYATTVGARFHARVGEAVDRDDIIQNGYMGLLEAIRTFDPDKASFKTYANRQIRWKIQDSLRGGDWLPRKRRDNVRIVQQALLLLQQRKNTAPTDADLATETGLTEHDVRIAYEDYVASRVHSLNDLTGYDDSPGEERGNRIADRVEAPIDEVAIRSAMHSHLLSAVRHLSDRDKQMIALYYYGNHTLEEIGEVFSIGYSRVSQLLKRAVFILRTSIEGTD